MWNDPAGFLVGLTPGYRLHDIEVVQDVIQAAVVRESIEERPHSVLSSHWTSFLKR